jgi:hypothetical protein
VEKIPVIHSSGGVYYHHHPFFLSKLTKEGKAGAARTLFCLQKKKEVGHCRVRTLTQALPDLCLVCRKNEAPPSPPERRWHPASTLSTCKNGSTVEKALHIHRSRCAERTIFLPASFLSNIGSASIQCLSSRSVDA